MHARFDASSSAPARPACSAPRLAGQRGLRVLLRRPRREGRREDPHLRRRPLQLHQPSTPARRNFESSNPTSAARRCPATRRSDFIALVETPRHRLPREAQGPAVLRRLGAQIIDMLLAECAAGGVAHWQPCAVDGRAPRPARLSRSRPPAARCSAPRLVVATGGLSIPKIGASDFGYRARARSSATRIVETAPGAGAADASTATPGRRSRRWPAWRCRCASPPARHAAAPRFDEDLLFTHRGLSGPGRAADLELLAAGRAA